MNDYFNALDYSTNVGLIQKHFFVMISNYEEIIPAIKCVLWTLKNEPKTIEELLSYIIITEKENYLPISEYADSEIHIKITTQINFAISTDLLHFQKIKNKNKNIYLFYNPTDKRKGYFYNGKLCKLKELADINNVPMITIQTRIARGMNVHKAIQK